MMRVLISGAGIAGPTLAWFLAQDGASVTVLEKSPSLLAQGQNIDIEGSARDVIQRMGLTEQVRQRNTTEKGTQFIGPDGLPFALFPVNKGNRNSFTSEFEILRGDLATILYEATKDHPNVTYRFGVTVEDVISNNDTEVKLKLSDGQTEEFDVVVAADGQWSRVRQQCFSSDSVKVVDKNAFVAYYTVSRIFSDNDWWNVYQAIESRTISLRPDPYGTTRVTLSRMPSDEAHKKAWISACKSDRKTQFEFIKAEFADAGWQAERVLNAMDEAPDFYLQAVQQIRMSKWSSSRVICLGDAAFAPTPFTGMGTSLAITGAYLLAGELSKLGKGEHPSIAFDAYENMFRPFVEKTQEIPFFVPGIAHPATAWKRWLLQSLVWTASKILAIPWIASKAQSGTDSSFKLPDYPALPGEAVNETKVVESQAMSIRT